MDVLTPICQMKDLPLGGSTTCRRESLEPTDIAMGFNQRKPPDRTVCVAVDLSAAFDTVCHRKLLTKI